MQAMPATQASATTAPVMTADVAAGVGPELGEPLLEAKGSNQFYGESHTLWDAGLVVPKGTGVCLMGRNGVGKTTLLKVIMALLAPVSGTMKVGEKPLSPAWL